jgi:hypothetical protein
MFVPGPLCYVVALGLRQLQVSAPRIKDDARVVLAAAEDAVVRHHQALNLTSAAAKACAAEPAPVLAPAQPLPSSDASMITVAQAAGLLGVTEQRVRRLAGEQQISGRKVARDTWELDRASVIAYGEQRRRRRGNGSSKAPGRDEGEDRRGGPVAA